MTYLFALHMSELTPIRWLMGWIPLEDSPTLVGGRGTNHLGGELDFSIERGGSVDSQEFGSMLDEWR